METMRMIRSYLFAAILAGAVISAARAASPSEVRVEPALLEAINSDETAGYLVYIREKADLSPAYNMNWRDRGRFVMETLQATAKRTQKTVRQTLDNQGARYEAFWVDNIIAVDTANRATFDALRALPEVESLRERRKPILYRPVSVKPAALVRAIESNLTHIGVDQVWNKGCNGQGIVVGNIDTGVRYTHEVLVNQYRGNTGGGSYDHNYNWWDPYSASTIPSDTDGHGSHTMGTMVGDDGAGNQVGMAPGAKWIAAMGFDPNSTDAGLLSCGQFMTAPTDLNGTNANPDMRPHIVNNSWGDCGQSYDNWYQGVIDAWHAAGIYPVFSNGNAGNCGYSYPPGLNTVGNPARYGSVTGVGATGTSDGTYATFSNWGPTDNPDTINPTGYPYLKPQVCAPGTNRSATNTGDSAYMTINGTSMAAPHVAGLIALMWSASPSLVGDYALTENIIEQTAVPINYDSGGTPAPGPGNIPNYATGWGEIDALAAVATAVSSGTNSILAGQVTDTTDSTPIPNATVLVTATSYTAPLTADAQGFYQGYITTGTYTVSFSAFGYISQTVNGVTIVKDTTTTQDAALTPATPYTISGAVCDALTSWPLYSRVTIAGHPDGGVWTDPVTGAYSVDLPEGTTWTLTFDAWVDGYLTATRVVPPLSVAQTLDVGLLVDVSNLVAPGYTSRTYFMEEDFESDNGGFTLDGVTSTTWEWGTPTAWPSSAASGTRCWGTNLDGNYANDEDAQLISPVYDLSSFAAPLGVTWWQAYYVENSIYDQAYAEYRVDGGTWQTMWEHSAGTTQQTWEEKGGDISDAAGRTVQFRFRLVSDNVYTYAGYYVDEFRIVSGATVPDGGLIVGNVAGTGPIPLVSATVSNTSYTATTMATPDDPNVNDEFYTLYSPAGAQSATAQATYYAPETVSLTVPAGGTVRQDFLLDLAPYHTLSGIVQDPLTGWPLYAKVECSANGYPTTSTWSDPFTGTYSLSLVTTGDWSIRGSTWVDGYSNMPHPIGSPSADTSFTLNLAPSLDAPGYTSATYILSEGFEGGPFPPAGWTDYDIDGGNTRWSSSTAYVHSGSSSAYHAYNMSAYQDGWLVTPPTTLTAQFPTVSFWEYTRWPGDYGKQSMWIKTGTFATPPTGWVELAEFDNPVAQWRQQTVDLSAYTGQTVWLALCYQGTNATNWHIDDFEIGQLVTPDGGLVGGFVTDADTSLPIDGATIRIADQQTQTAATPDDPAVNNGFYTIYSPAGSQTATADVTYYYPETATPIVPAGDIVRQDFALAPAPYQTLSGTVQDAVTGWPLYAEVTCQANGYATTSTWSNPFTGAYSLSLAATGDWTINGSAWVGGYNDAPQSIGSLSADTSFTLNLQPTLSAPGYTTATYALNEGFESNLFAPEGWTAYDIDGGDTQWSSSTAAAHSGSWSATHLSSAGTYQDGWLVTPPTTLTLPNARLAFWEITGSTANYVKHSLWIKTGTFAAPPSGWTEVAEFANPTGSWRQQVVDLSSYAGQTAWIAFRYEGQDATQWYIDDIEAGSLLTPTGGLVGGFVTDANTSAYLTGATVTIHDQQTQTATTPDDADVPDGLYFLYAPAGDSPSTAALNSYAPANVTVSAVAGETTRQDYALNAGRLQVSPDSLQVYVLPGNATTRTLILTNTGSAALDFSIREINRGATSLTLAAQPPRNPETFRIESPTKTADCTEKGIAGTPPRNAIASGDPAPNTIGATWETMTPMPAGRVFNAVVADMNGYIYVMGGTSDAGGNTATNTNYRYDTSTDAWQEMTPMPAALNSIDAIEIDNSIYVPGDSTTDNTYVYNIATDTWSTIATNNGYTARSQYQVVAIGTDLYVLGGIVAAASASTTEVWVLDTVSGTWSAGVAMQKSRTSFSAAAINGTIYVTGGVVFPGFTPDMTAEKFDGAAWSYIASLPDGGGTYTRWSYNADGWGIDGLWLAAGRRDASWAVLNHAAYYNPDTDTWTDSPTIPALNQGRVYMEGAVALDGYFYVIGGRDSAGATIYATNERLEVGYGMETEVPWLSVDQTSGTIASGESLTVTATMDSAGISPGTYRASLRFSATTPYGSPIVPVTMVVSEQGQLQVNISPAEVISGGAQWRLEGENDLQWSDSGDIRTDVPISSQTVEFKDVTGWVTPANQVVVVTTGSMTIANITYERQTFSLRYLAGVGGTVSEPTSQTVIYGQDGTAVTASGNEGYYFTQWSDGSTDNPRQDTNVTQDITVTAQFARYTYQLTYIAGEHGTIDGETSRTFVVLHGNDGTTVTAVPEAGYWFIRWSDDSTMNPRMDTGVTSSVIVTAIFEPPASGIATSQTCSVYSDGHVYAGLYNFSTGGGWVTWLDSEGGGQIAYDLPRDQWLGFYLYDYTSGQWTRALYALKN